MKRYRRGILWLFLLAWSTTAQAEKINFIFTSDLHYGLSRTFRGEKTDAQIVNQAQIDKLNALPQAELPDGQGKLGAVEFLAITGDIVNRGGGDAPTAAVSWRKFQEDYLGRDPQSPLSGGRLNLQGKDGHNIPVYLQVGNHDISNAIGYPDVPLDTTPFVEISNRMLGTSLTVSTTTPLDYPARRVNYSVDRGGLHLIFANIWPDREIQRWMDNDLKKVPPNTPVFIFTHVPIDPGETKLFRNPAAPTTYTTTFVGAIPYTIGSNSDYTSTAVAKTELLAWLAKHKQVKAYFCGHNNFCEFATLTPDPAEPTSVMGVFRADSPLKGGPSLTDETKLSFNVLTVDTDAWTLTAREYLWNSTKQTATSGKWGASKTISIATPRESPPR